MRYDVRLRLHYDYEQPTAGHHLVRVLPRALPGTQWLQQSQLLFEPHPEERQEFTDFFGNHVVSIALRTPHQALDVEMRASLVVERAQPQLDLSPDLAGLRAELVVLRSLAPDSPSHFLAPSLHIPLLGRISHYAAASLSAGASVLSAVQHLGRRLRNDFAYDPEATEVDTPVAKAFDMRRGVCQDFSHIMIAGLRGLGIPAGYVSGVLRTQPPPGEARLEGADATHAWVRVWCGQQMGWQEFDPTNAIAAGDGHITIGHGRDYGDVAPIVGVLKTSGAHEASQAVDVLALE
jgi:transglutaminase-like putative cysteine protease